MFGLKQLELKIAPATLTWSSTEAVGTTNTTSPLFSSSSSAFAASKSCIVSTCRKKNGVSTSTDNRFDCVHQFFMYSNCVFLEFAALNLSSFYVEESHLVEKAIRESWHSTRWTHMFYGLVLSCHTIVTDCGGRDDVSISIVITLITGGRLNHNRGDRHLFLQRTSSTLLSYSFFWLSLTNAHTTNIRVQAKSLVWTHWMRRCVHTFGLYCICAHTDNST